MHAARTDRLAKPVVRVVLMMRKHFFPALYQTLRDRLRADVHQSPLGKLVIRKPDVAPVDRVEDVLRPRHQQPHDRAPLFRHGVQDKLRLCPFQQDCPSALQKTSEPVHLRPGVVERRNAQEHILLRLPVVILLHLARVHQTLMVVQNRLRKTCRARREIDRGIVRVRQRDHRRLARTVRREAVIVLRKTRAVVPREK